MSSTNEDNIISIFFILSSSYKDEYKFFNDLKLKIENFKKRIKENIKRIKKLPKLKMPNIKSIDELNSLSLDDFVLDGYNPHPAITAEMAV